MTNYLVIGEDSTMQNRNIHAGFDSLEVAENEVSKIALQNPSKKYYLAQIISVGNVIPAECRIENFEKVASKF